MALKRITRPQGLVPSWANDELMNDPGEAWDATATKVEPGAGKRDDGWLPQENPPAQHRNHLDNAFGQWIQFFSDIQIMNWWDGGEPKETSPATAECVVYDEGDFSWIVGSRADIVTKARTEEGEWQEIQPTGGAGTWTWAATKRPDFAPSHTGPRTLLGSSVPGPAPPVVEYSTVPWTALALPLATGPNGHSNTGVWDGGNGRWLVGGQDNVVPSFWYDATLITGFTQVVPTAVNSTEVLQIATDDNGNSVAIGDSAPFDVWTSANGTTWAQATPTGIVAGESARAIAWDAEGGQWVLLTNKSCYVSVNGTSWSSVATFTNGSFQYRCLSIVGSHWVACSASDAEIRFSGDGGATWRVLRLPKGDYTSSDPLVGITYSRFRGRFAAVYYDTPALPGRFVYSLAAPTTVVGIDAISEPTVT